MAGSPGNLVPRAAVPEDALAMAELDARVTFPAFSESQWLRICDPADQFAYANVITNAEALVGFIALSTALDEATVLALAVQPEAHGCGHGRNLLACALAELQQNAIARCLLEVRASNVPALALYRRCGFDVDGMRKGYYRTATGKEDAVLMSRQVSAQ